ncbi:MAG TPA: hypothetical protein EYO33_31285 [Phycisphaerales bacterium]|nr:hypothetical protein [Phycisphaerales bacterium]
MTAVIIPGSHQNNFVPVFEIKGAKKLGMEWLSVVRNEGEGPGWVDWWIEFKHDKGSFVGIGGGDTLWVEYAPGWPVSKIHPYDKGSGGLKPIAKGALTGPEQRNFAAIGGVEVSPGKSIRVDPGETINFEGTLTIPGPGFSPKAAEFWRFMETTGGSRDTWNFHLTVDLIEQREPGAYYEGGRAQTIARHRWENIFSVPPPEGGIFARRSYRT